MTVQEQLEAACFEIGHAFDVIERTKNAGPISVRCNRCHWRWPVSPEGEDPEA